jgi:hypothetical protein
MNRVFLVAIAAAACLHITIGAQQGGLNTPVLPGLPADPADTLAQYKSDILEQRQVEADILTSTRNHLHLLSFFNDYRAVNIADDAGQAGVFASRGLKGVVDRVVAWITGRKPGTGALPAHSAAAEARVGLSRSYDGGLTWHGGLLPKIDNLDAMTDPRAAAAPCGIGYAAFVAFTRGGASKVVVWRFQDQNNLDGGDSWVSQGYSIVATGNNATNGQFHDLPSIAVDPVRSPTGDPCAHRVYLGWAQFNGFAGASTLNFARTTAGDGPWTPVWSKSSIKTSSRVNQGVALAVDPRPGLPTSLRGGGTLYYVWREFQSTDNPNGVWITSSKDFGATFLKKHIQVTAGGPMYPFDQSTISTADAGFNPELLAFRSNALPTVRVAPRPQGDAAVYIAWQERVTVFGCPTDPACGLPDPVGEPRIVLTRSFDGGLTWTDHLGGTAKRRAVDFGDRDTNPPAPGFGYLPQSRPSGGQVMPHLSYGGGRLGLLYFESRGPLTGTATLLAGINRQLDARYALLNPASGAMLGTMQVSRYPVKQGANLLDGEQETDIAEINQELDPQFRFPRINKRVNVPNSANGTSPFIGDFIGATPVVQFVLDPNAAFWRWATNTTDVPFQGFRALFVDSRNQGPPEGATAQDPKLELYPNYVPPGVGVRDGCTNQHTRNHDVLHVLVDASVAVNAIATFKQLGSTVERAFPLTVTNGTGTEKTFQLTFAPNIASFDQFDDTLDVLNVALFPYSSATRTVYLKSTNPKASVTVSVTEVTCGPTSCTPVTGGLSGKVTLNLDPTTPTEAGDPNNFTDTHTPLVSNPLVSNLNPPAPLVSNKALNPLVSNPLVSNNTLNPLVSNPLVSNSAVPDGTPVYDVIDTTWKVTGDGTVASAMSAAVNVANAQALEGSYVFQLLIHKTSSYGGAAGCDAKDVIQDQIISSIPNPLVSNPLVSNPLVSNPLVSNPLVSNSTFALSAPGEGGAAAARFSAQAIEAAISPDSTLQMDFKPDAVFVTLRAYQLVASPPVVFNPFDQPPAVAVFSQSVDVVDGQEQGDSIEDAPVAFSGPDLAVPATVTVAPSTPAGGLVQFPIGGWTVTNAGSADAVAPFSHGYYLSTDAAITNSDLLLGTETTTASIAPNGSQAFQERTLTIPINTVPGNYFIGLLADRTNAVAEGNEGNNAASVALTVTPAVSNAPLVVTVDADAGTGSLRQAIINANAAPGRDTITFNIPSGGTPSIILASPLPEITTPVIIDGTTQPTSNRVDITGSDTQPDGLRISGGSSTIRGLIIRRFTGNGILITGAGGNLIEGNFIGIDQSGLEEAGNGANGVHIVDVPNNTIGGAAAASRNVISANAGEGVRIDGANATGNIVIGNYIGLSAPGTADFGNGASGVYIRRAPGNSVIGNIVSGNDGFAGIAICGSVFPVCGGGDIGEQTSNAAGNIVRSNVVGVDSSGEQPLGNAGYGVSIDGAPLTEVGGTTPGAGNVIAYSGLAGVIVFNPPTSGNRILRNSIYFNGGLGIDLAPAGVTANDLGDPDDGPNRFQNFPVVTSATNTGTATNVQWSLNTTANTQVVVDFYSNTSCDATGYGQGRTYLASVTQTTNASGNLTVSTDLPLLANGVLLTAVATSAGGGTSEFSGCQMVTPPGLVYWPVSEGGNGHVYEFVQQGGLSWTAANTAAESRPNFNGMLSHLVSITNAAENAFVEALRNGGPLRAWIGLYDPDQTGIGSWTWTTGESTGYFNWDQSGPPEPNNPTTEFWVEMFGGGTWNNNLVFDPSFPTNGYLVEYEFAVIG